MIERIRGPIAIIFVSLGCNQVFGLDETVPAADRGMVTGVYKLRVIENQSDGTPLVMDQPYPLDQLEADVELDDGTRRAVVLRADGSFAFTTATIGQRYSITFITTYSRRTYQNDATNLVLIERIAGRIDRQLVPTGTVLEYDVPNRPTATATSEEEVQSTGIWARKKLTPPPGPLTFD